MIEQINMHVSTQQPNWQAKLSNWMNNKCLSAYIYIYRYVVKETASTAYLYNPRWNEREMIAMAIVLSLNSFNLIKMF